MIEQSKSGTAGEIHLAIFADIGDSVGIHVHIRAFK
jgi:hypothetical protein